MPKILKTFSPRTNSILSVRYQNITALSKSCISEEFARHPDHQAVFILTSGPLRHNFFNEYHMYPNTCIMTDDKPKKPNEIQEPGKNPDTIPSPEPEPVTWPKKEPEIQPEREPLTIPPTAPPEVPSPPQMH